MATIGMQKTRGLINVIQIQSPMTGIEVGPDQGRETLRQTWWTAASEDSGCRGVPGHPRETQTGDIRVIPVVGAEDLSPESNGLHLEIDYSKRKST